MTDVSESLQVRTDDEASTIARLRTIGFNGFAFGGGHGWLSLVPYGGPASLALREGELASFAAKLDAPVLNYFVNDFSWGFELALPDGRTTAYGRWLGDPKELALTDEQARMPVLDDGLLASVMPTGATPPALGAPDYMSNGDLEWNAFAETAGFPYFEQLNPTYATDHPEEMHQMGGIEVGTRPQSMPHDTP